MNAGQKDLAGIAASINDLAARTRDAKVDPSELSGSTFTITNTGSGGALFDTPVLNMPETAIMGVGASKSLRKVKWGIAKNMVFAWVLTFPCCGLIGFLLAKLFMLL